MYSNLFHPISIRRKIFVRCNIIPKLYSWEKTSFGIGLSATPHFSVAQMCIHFNVHTVTVGVAGKPICIYMQTYNYTHTHTRIHRISVIKG